MLLVIHDDKPIYQLDFSQAEKQVKEYFVVHSALDSIDNALKVRKDYYLGQIKTDDVLLYAYVNAVQVRLVLVLGNKKEIDKSQEKGIKEFFSRVNDALAQAFLNPLYSPKEPIRSKIFEEKVKAALRDNLRGLTDRKR